jgi:hypothetical protein
MPDAPANQPSTALTVLPERPSAPSFIYEPEPPRPQSRFWRAVKWPLRKLLKAIYLVGRAAGRHKLIALAILLVLVGLAAGGFAFYRLSTPAPRTPNIAISDASHPALRDSVNHWLHGFAAFDAAEMWNSLSPQMQASLTQSGSSESALQGVLDQNRSSHVAVEYHYVGGAETAQGTAYYVVQVDLRGDAGSGALTWYFLVDDASGKIAQWQDLPQTPSSATGTSSTSGAQGG